MTKLVDLLGDYQRKCCLVDRKEVLQVGGWGPGGGRPATWLAGWPRGLH